MKFLYRLKFVVVCLSVFLIIISCSDMINRYRLAEPDAGQATRGKEFFVSFQENPVMNTGNPYEISLLISGDYNTTGQVVVPGLSFTQAYSVSAHGVARVTFGRTVRVASSDVVEDLGIHVTASQPVVVCGLNYEQGTSDSFLALPVQSCGTEYYVMDYQSYILMSGSSFTVVGLADATTVAITPTVTSGSRTAGIAYSISMNRGQTYRLCDLAATGDMTGTHIVSDKPVAVFSGNTLAFVPAGTSYGDHLTEQLVPVAAWETRYRLVPLMGRTADTVRILAASDGTVVSWNGSPVATLNAGQFYEGVLTANAVVTADHPVLAAHYAQGSQSVNPPTNTGDPFMALVPMTWQFRTQYSFCAPHADFPDNYVNLIVPATAVSGMLLDGAAISPSLFSSIDGDYYWARVSVTEGNHLVSGPQKFGLIMYGYGYNDSYGNAGG
ncbi:MAG: IgGFc-binding protein [Spirochaetales bacterium]|nr:IgGFc-binding protein [Spirochaetales bacterium]